MGPAPRCAWAPRWGAAWQASYRGLQAAQEEVETCAGAQAAVPCASSTRLCGRRTGVVLALGVVVLGAAGLGGVPRVHGWLSDAFARGFVTLTVEELKPQGERGHVASDSSDEKSSREQLSKHGKPEAIKLAMNKEISSTKTWPKSAVYCGRSEAGFDYLGTELKRVANVDSASDCCALCQEAPRCRVWMWGEKRGNVAVTAGGDQVCSLRTVGPEQQVINKVPRLGVVSGVPFQWDRPNSLFCFMLVLPKTSEEQLVKLQHQKRWGIFDCDEWQVVSNESISVGRGLEVSVIKSDLVCDVGGEFKTALNNDIFTLVWQKVIADARYQYNDWTVKVDPDCVFFPQRLRVATAFHPDTYHGIYLNNCKFGLHGPLEVFSAQAVNRWATGHAHCQEHFLDVCSGPCLWGEDMFIDQCLDKVLKVHRVDDWNLLSETHCESHDWEDCDNHRVAFHPFKSVEAFETCMAKGDYGTLPLVA